MLDDGPQAQPGQPLYSSGEAVPTDSPIDALAAGLGSGLAGRAVLGAEGRAQIKAQNTWAKLRDLTEGSEKFEFLPLGRGKTLAERMDAQKIMRDPNLELNDLVAARTRNQAMLDEIRHMNKAGFKTDPGQLSALEAEAKQLEKTGFALRDKILAGADRATEMQRLKRLRENMRFYRDMKEMGLSDEEILKMMGNDPW